MTLRRYAVRALIRPIAAIGEVENLEPGEWDIFKDEFFVNFYDALPEAANHNPRAKTDCAKDCCCNRFLEGCGFKVRGHPGKCQEAQRLSDHIDNGGVLERWIGAVKRKFAKTDQQDLGQKYRPDCHQCRVQ